MKMISLIFLHEGDKDSRLSALTAKESQLLAITCLATAVGEKKKKSSDERNIAWWVGRNVQSKFEKFENIVM